MSGTDSIRPHGDKIRKAVLWIGDTLREHPEKSRACVIKEAAIRFDLTPLECDYLDQDLDRR